MILSVMPHYMFAISRIVSKASVIIISHMLHGSAWWSFLMQVTLFLVDKYAWWVNWLKEGSIFFLHCARSVEYTFHLQWFYSISTHINIFGLKALFIDKAPDWIESMQVESICLNICLRLYMFGNFARL